MNTTPKPGDVQPCGVAIDELRILAAHLIRIHGGRVTLHYRDIAAARGHIRKLKTTVCYDGAGVPCIAAECLD